MVWASDVALEQMGNPAGVDMQGSSWDAPHTITPLATARRFEPYEVFFAGKVGLATALRYTDEIGIDDIADRNAELANRLRLGLAAVPGIELRDRGDDPCAIVTFTVEGHQPDSIQRSLRERSINVSTSSATSARLDFPARGLDTVVRSSVHYYNDDADIDALIEAVDSISRPG
jgi:selenocysteine lyase/cysteine desulfurase